MAPPKVFLFDIGGVVVVSPMSAIAAYEQTHSIPPGYINTAISASSPNGTWARAERGEIPLDASFFASFKRDLTNESLWKRYYAKHLASTRGVSADQAKDEALVQTPPVPDIDAEALFWTMMGVSRAPDPYVFPALRRLRAEADRRAREGEEERFIVAAMSNTIKFPEGHEFNDPSTPAGRFNAEMRALFHLFVSSAHAGRRKPERGMYEFTLGECEKVAREQGALQKGEGLRGEDVVFLDDIGANLRGAREFGIKGIKVIMGRTQEAVKELERIAGVDLSRGKARL